MGTPLDNIPTRLGQLGGCIPRRVWDKTAIRLVTVSAAGPILETVERARITAYINDSFIVLDITEHLESSQFPFATFRGVNRGNLKIAMYR